MVCNDCIRSRLRCDRRSQRDFISERYVSCEVETNPQINMLRRPQFLRTVRLSPAFNHRNRVALVLCG